MNSDDNGGLGALMSATGYSMEQYYVLGRNDYYSGEPQSQAMDEAIYQAQQQSGKDFLAFQGKLMANGMIAGLTGGIGNVAIEVTAGTRVGSMLEYALTTRTGAAATGALVNAGAQAMKNDGHVNLVEVGTSAASAYLGLGRGFWWNTALGTGANVVNTEYGNLTNGADDSVWLSAGTGALTTGFGYGVGELAKANKGGMAPVIIGNTLGASSTEALNAYIDKIKNDAKLKDERNMDYLEDNSYGDKNK